MTEDTSSAPLEQTPIRRSACTSIREETHWKCLILTLLMYGSLAVVLWCQLSFVEVIAYNLEEEHTFKDSPCQDGYTFIPVAFLILLYLVYLVECWYSDVRIEIQYREDINTVYSRIRRIRSAYPVVWWRAISYHYNRHTRQVTRYRHGDAYTTTQEYFERINTHSAAGAFDFSECGVKDVSRQLTGLEEYPLTRITFNKNFMFLNEEAENDYLSQRARFFTENEGRDENLETREGLGLTEVEFTDEMVTYACSESLPWYVSMVMFWITSLFILSWPFRILISMKTAVVDYQIEKLFGTNYNSGMITIEPITGEGCTITRVTAVDSNRSLESMIRDNRHVVPSYSEALLMDIANGNHLRADLTPTGPGPPAAAQRGKQANGVNDSGLRGSMRGSIRGSIRSHRLHRSATTGVGLCYVSSLTNDRSARSSTSDWTLRSPLTPNNRSLSYGHTPTSSLRIIPSRSSSSHMIGISNIFNRVKPLTHSHNTPPATSETAHRTSMLPNGESDPSASQRKPLISSTASTPSYRRHKRPTSLPLCFGSQGSQQEEIEMADESQIESWVLMDGGGEMRTVTWHRANGLQQSTFNNEQMADVPVDSPPPYDAALNIQLPGEGEHEVEAVQEEQTEGSSETSV